VVLVDSRTGATEMGGICGYQLDDIMVMMCSANHQNVDGTWSKLQDFRSKAETGQRRGRALEIVVVPARVEQQSQDLLDAFQARFAQRFEDMVPDRLRSLGLGFMDLAIPYDPLFAFEERVARGQEEAEPRQHLSDVFGTLADVIAVLSPLPAGVRATVDDAAESPVVHDG